MDRILSKTMTWLACAGLTLNASVGAAGEEVTSSAECGFPAPHGCITQEMKQ